MEDHYIADQNDFDIEETAKGNIRFSFYGHSWTMPPLQASIFAERWIKLLYTIHLAKLRVAGTSSAIGGVPIPEDLLVDLPWGPQSY